MRLQVAQHAPPSPIREEKEEEEAWLITTHPPSPRSSQVPTSVPPAVPQATAPESMSSSGEQVMHCLQLLDCWGLTVPAPKCRCCCIGGSAADSSAVNCHWLAAMWSSMKGAALIVI